MRNAARFGRTRSTFTCHDCGHLTREAGENDGLDLCPICAELAGLQNTLSDNGEESFREWGLVKAVENCRIRADHLRNDAERAAIHVTYSELFDLIDDSHPTAAPAESAKREGHYSTAELVEIVKENARKRYDRSGHLIIETMTDAQIAEYIGSSTTPKGAIFWVWKRGCVREVHGIYKDRQGA